MNDAVRRGIRTFMDVAFVEAMLQLVEAFGAALTEAQHVAILVVAPFFVSAVKNAMEDAGTIPALLKAPPSPGANPIPDDLPADDIPTTGAPDAGQSVTQFLLVVVLVLVILWLVGVEVRID